MIEAEDAVRVLDTVAKNLVGVSNNKSNFERLPDTFWGYFARGHDGKGKFGVIVAYSENGSDVDELIKIYEQWVAKARELGELLHDPLAKFCYCKILRLLYERRILYAPPVLRDAVKELLHAQDETKS